MTQRNLHLAHRFKPWERVRYTQVLERRVMLAEASLADERERRKEAEALLARRWAERPNQF